MNRIKVYTSTDTEYYKLEMFVNLVNAACVESPYCLYLDDIYFDYGQNWWYTSPITREIDDKGNTWEWQTLCPRDYNILVSFDSYNAVAFAASMYADYLMRGKAAGEDFNLDTLRGVA